MPGEDNTDLGGSGNAGGSSGSGGSAVTSAGHGGTVGSAGHGGTVGSAGTAANVGGSAGKGGSASGGTTGMGGGSAGKGGSASGGAPSGGTGGTVASGGKGGTTGSGGTVAVGGMTGSGGAVSGNGVSIQYKAVTTDAMTPYMQCELYVVNAGPNTFAISELKARYYYTDDVKSPMQFTLNWKHIGTSGANVDDLTVNETAMAMVPTATNADTYLEFSFSSGAQSTIGPGQSIAFSWRFNPVDQNLKFSQTNDYSFDASKTSQADWSHIVLLHNGAVIWGATP